MMDWFGRRGVQLFRIFIDLHSEGHFLFGAMIISCNHGTGKEKRRRGPWKKEGKKEKEKRKKKKKKIRGKQA